MPFGDLTNGADTTTAAGFSISIAPRPALRPRFQPRLPSVLRVQPDVDLPGPAARKPAAGRDPRRRAARLHQVDVHSRRVQPALLDPRQAGWVLSTIVTREHAALAAEFQAAAAEEPIDLARAALLIARLEYPDLDPAPSMRRLDELGCAGGGCRGAAGRRLRCRCGWPPSPSRLFEHDGFAGNRAHYDDFPQQLPQCGARAELGIPITLGARVHRGRAPGRRRDAGGVVSRSLPRPRIRRRRRAIGVGSVRSRTPAWRVGVARAAARAWSTPTRRIPRIC